MLLHARQREHIATVMHIAEHAHPQGLPRTHDDIIQDSWLRCVREHRLDPTRMQEAVILPDARLREHQDQMEAFLQIARHGLEALYQQVAGTGYVVLLTDGRGITVDFLGDLVFEPSLRRAGLYLGADWSEAHAGTCGVGTCLSTGQALTVHQDDHFDATHIPLTCTTAPIFDTLGRLNAVLDISALSSPGPKSSQHMALQMVRLYAQRIEDAAFLHRHRQDWVLRLSRAPQFLDVDPEYLLALDTDGRVIGHNRPAQRLFESELNALPARLDTRDPGSASRLIGLPFARLFDARFEDIGVFVRARAAEQRPILVAGTQRLLFLLASPPPPRPVRAAAGRSEAAVPATLAALSGGDPALDRLLQRAARLVNSPVSVLITGETGSGKEVLAKALHVCSERRQRPFVAVNCAAIPESLIESELFGHLPGSFSGAGPKGKRGLIQAADGGTLFLDEIGDMPRALQARLLRVLAEHEVLPIGATQAVPVNLRVIAATHCDLETLVREGRFRDDLYYRLNGAHFTLPPLRDRQDLESLIDRMLAEGSAPSAPPRVGADARAALRAHLWPGNLRELRNVLDYARTVCNDGVLCLSDLPEGWGAARSAVEAVPPGAHRLTEPMALAAPTAVAHAGSAPLAATSGQAASLEQALRAARWNVSAVARQLGCSRMTVYRHMKRLGVVSPLEQCASSDAVTPVSPNRVTPASL